MSSSKTKQNKISPPALKEADVNAEGAQGQKSFTPGPWHVNRYRACIQTRHPNQPNTVPNSVVCYTAVSHVMPETTDADAALIAAAPELLEACQFFMGALDDGDLVRDTSKDYDESWGLKAAKLITDLAKAEAAIRKATSVPNGSTSSPATGVSNQ